MTYLSASCRATFRTRQPSWLLAAGLTAVAAGCGSSPGGHGFDSPAPEGSRLPHLSADARARPVLSWVEPSGDGHALVYAVLGESGWQPPVTVAQGGDWFVNWADVPSVRPVGDELWAAHWLVEQPGGMYAYDIALTLSRDGGQSWGPSFTPHHDGTPTEHGFVSLWPMRLMDGKAAVGAIWLDGRDTLLDPARSTSETPRTALRSAVFDAAGNEVSSGKVDGRVCDCCQTDVALTPEGPMTAYRGRGDGEVRDIHVATRGKTGWQASGPIADDGWVIEGCPVNGPAIAASGDAVAVAWYTEAADQKRVQLVRRANPAAAWSRPTVVDEGAPMGRVDLALLADGDAAVSWMAEAEDGGAVILLARVGGDGAVGQPLRIARVEASRPAGFPRLIRHGDGLLLAWTHWEDGVSRVVMGRVATDDLPRSLRSG